MLFSISHLQCRKFKMQIRGLFAMQRSNTGETNVKCFYNLFWEDMNCIFIHGKINLLKVKTLVKRFLSLKAIKGIQSNTLFFLTDICKCDSNNDIYFNSYPYIFQFHLITINSSSFHIMNLIKVMQNCIAILIYFT